MNEIDDIMITAMHMDENNDITASWKDMQKLEGIGSINRLKEIVERGFWSSLGDRITGVYATAKKFIGLSQEDFDNLKGLYMSGIMKFEKCLDSGDTEFKSHPIDVLTADSHDTLKSYSVDFRGYRH